MTDGIMSALLLEMKKKGITKRSVYNFLEMSPSTLDGYFSGKYPISLNDYIKLCKLLELNPSFFFEANHTNLVNEGNLQYATGKQIKQAIGAGSEVEQLKKEIEALKRENLLKDEIISLLKSKP